CTGSTDITASTTTGFSSWILTWTGGVSPGSCVAPASANPPRTNAASMIWRMGFSLWVRRKGIQSGGEPVGQAKCGRQTASDAQAYLLYCHRTLYRKDDWRAFDDREKTAHPPGSTQNDGGGGACR